MPVTSPLPDLPAGPLSRLRARSAGLTVDQLRGPRFTRLAHDLYLPRETCTDAARERCLLAVLPPDAAVSHTSAVRAHGLPAVGLQPGEDRLQVTLDPRRVLPQRREVVVHGARLPEDDVCLVEGRRVTAPERTFLDMAAVLRREDLVVLGDAMLAAGATTPDALTARVAPVRRRRGIVLARSVLPLLDGRSQSPPESIVRLRIADSGLPAPRPQCPVRDAAGWVVAHVDLGYEEARVAVEYEGRHHAAGDQFDRDIDRYAILSALGWLVVRASARHLRGDSRLLLIRIRSALRQRGVAC